MAHALNVLQGAFGRVALLRMSHSLVVHAHPHCHVLIKLSGADGAFEVRGNICPLTDSTVVLVNAWEPHAYVHEPSEAGTVILALYIQPEWLAGIEKILEASGSPEFFSNSVGSIDTQVRKAAEDLADAISGKADEGAGPDCLVRLMICVAERFAEWHEGAPGGSSACLRPRDFRIRKALSFMQSNLGDSFTLRDVARQSGLSRSHLFQLFQNDLKLSPNLYFNSLRVEAAVERLAASRDPLANVSDSLGFSMQSHFTRFFRNNLGASPSEYRRRVVLAHL